MTGRKEFAVALIGCGKMGGAILHGWLTQGLAAESVLVIDPKADGLPEGITVLPSLDDVAAGTTAETVLLAVKPQMMDGVVDKAASLAGPATVFLSIAAGKTIAYFQKALGSDARIVRAMPNTPAAIGRGMIVLCAGTGVSDEQQQRCEKLLSASGSVAWIDDEALMDAVTALSGSGPAYIFHLVEAMAQAGVAEGLSEEVAMQLARQTVIGSAALLYSSDLSAAQLRINVTSPGGTTAAALDHLMDQDHGLPPLMKRAIAAASRRGKELAG